ncbi:G-box-binding factor-like [Scaptodrosophila lebanonensis]|uniref:G-box-binding factor-like n=1 Tax=Drosophila lebanonensis TaxID=7225 RepID=A0A6J2TZF0_DROLE|nr:G-box-binding factor-like [Scaptodrosophila lebanonensis]
MSSKPQFRSSNKAAKRKLSQSDDMALLQLSLMETASATPTPVQSRANSPECVYYALQQEEHLPSSSGNSCRYQAMVAADKQPSATKTKKHSQQSLHNQHQHQLQLHPHEQQQQQKQSLPQQMEHDGQNLLQ